MTNLEWLADNLDNLYYCSLCVYAYTAKYERTCDLVCKDCEFRSNADVVKVLMEEHEEKKR